MTPQKALIYRDIPRLEPEVLGSLQGLGVADIYDALQQKAWRSCLLGQSLVAITPGLRSYGQAVTVYCSPNDNLMMHCGLYLARRGDMLVISNGGQGYGAIWGGNAAMDAKTAGVAGIIVDGPVRDVSFIRELQHPTWASSVSVTRGAKEGLGYVNRPVACGGCIVNPGDIVVGDDDGIVVFPREYVESLVGEVRQKCHDETALRRRLIGGERVFEVMRFDQLLKGNGIEIQDGHWDSPEIVAPKSVTAS